mmetsp:Transcript_7850/g.20142  ORF Transcript_7850/g.20142 Transcript_7850/m.20142 type:complete len:275 (-) Transcript_7850:726-1550(-)
MSFSTSTCVTSDSDTAAPPSATWSLSALIASDCFLPMTLALLPSWFSLSLSPALRDISSSSRNCLSSRRALVVACAALCIFISFSTFLLSISFSSSLSRSRSHWRATARTSTETSWWIRLPSLRRTCWGLLSLKFDVMRHMARSPPVKRGERMASMAHARASLILRCLVWFCTRRKKRSLYPVQQYSSSPFFHRTEHISRSSSTDMMVPFCSLGGRWKWSTASKEYRTSRPTLGRTCCPTSFSSPRSLRLYISALLSAPCCSTVVMARSLCPRG